MAKILLVEDDKKGGELLRDFLKEHYDVEWAESYTAALKRFGAEGFDVALLDIQLPDGNGIELLRELKAIDPELVAIFITAFGSVRSAVEGMQAGAFSYLTKPVDLAELTKLIESAVKHHRLVVENASLRRELEELFPTDIVTRSNAMKEVVRLVARVAPSDVAVLILGESGTGKELVARLLHRMSGRADKPFVALNCAALPDNLVEAELFGYEPGAFSGASKRKRGLAETADHGTLFLDEIGEMPLALQPKLLRFLEGQGFYRVGGTETVAPDVRIVSATDKPIAEFIEKGQFKDALYYRLSGITIKIPPLRERPDDIVALIEHFLSKYAKKYNRPVDGLTPAARDMLLRHRWSGNVRELIHSLEQAVLLSSGNLITVDELGFLASSLDAVGMTLRDVETAHIRKVLASCGGNVSRAAEILGIHRNTLTAKLREMGKANDS